MQGRYANRFGTYKTTLTTLNSGKFKAVWFEQPPAIFTKRVADATIAVDDLEKFCIAQETKRTGAAEQKAREAAEAEEMAFQMARALVEWFRDHKDEVNAAKVDLSRSAWHGLRDQSFLDQLQLTHSLATDVLAADQKAKAVANSAPTCAEYGITDERVDALEQEIKEYADMIAAPQSGIAERKGLTSQMQAKFNEVEAKFVTLDNLVLQFGRSPEGRELISAYQAARIVRDLGGSPSKAKTEAQPQPPAAPPA